MGMTGLHKVYCISCFDCNDDAARIYFGTRQMSTALPQSEARLRIYCTLDPARSSRFTLVSNKSKRSIGASCPTRSLPLIIPFVPFGLFNYLVLPHSFGHMVDNRGFCESSARVDLSIDRALWVAICFPPHGGCDGGCCAKCVSS